MRILYSSLRHKTRILHGKNLIHITPLDGDSFAVHTEDGGCYEGNLVVGADGVHSRVRAEMWRLADMPQMRRFENESK